MRRLLAMLAALLVAFCCFSALWSMHRRHAASEASSIMAPASHAKVNIIYDDDFGSDYDVATNMATLHKLADKGYFNILGIIVDGGWFKSVGIAKVFDTYYNRPEMYVGAYQGTINANSFAWGKSLLLAFHVGDVRADYPDCVKAYRRLLARAADGSVVLVHTGGFTCLPPLMQSTADSTSNETGAQLIKHKVTSLVFMGGFGTDPISGNETNFGISPTGTKYVLTNWTTQNGYPPMYGVDGPTGAAVLSGPYGGFFSDLNPGKKAFELNNRSIHPSWDSVAILFAAVQFGSDLNHTVYFSDIGDGTISTDGTTGYDSFSLDKPSGQHYLRVLNYLAVEQALDGYHYCCGFAGMPPSVHG